MSNEEEKGFVIKDRRSLDESGHLKESPPKEQEKSSAEKPGPETQATPPPLPEVNFSYLILSLSSTALFHIGEIPDPQTGQKKVDLPLAKHAIDTISMLKEKTRGNLTDEEHKMVEGILTDLRWRYVKAR